MNIGFCLDHTSRLAWASCLHPEDTTLDVRKTLSNLYRFLVVDAFPKWLSKFISICCQTDQRQDAPPDLIEIQAFPESNDVVGLKDIYLDFSISDSTINMVKDTITSGEKISGVGFKVTSSYNNGEKFRG